MTFLETKDKQGRQGGKAAWRKGRLPASERMESWCVILLPYFPLSLTFAEDASLGVVGRSTRGNEVMDMAQSGP